LKILFLIIIKSIPKFAHTKNMTPTFNLAKRVQESTKNYDRSIFEDNKIVWGSIRVGMAKISIPADICG
jgi:hypothetical protein